ncbi:MAG: SAM-dependent methyltransferase [Alcaligenaceae bacterium]|nr:SAM-dependent methyltransferase [Alcaligenaceae bacterium]
MSILHLIPVGLSQTDTQIWLPEETRKVAANLTVYIAENQKTARAWLKIMQINHPLQSVTIYTINAKTKDQDIKQWLHTHAAEEIGLVSEAGCPAVADPGARVVWEAHQQAWTVRPWVGPSSILLGLMASGLDGQRFTFHGYPPIQEAEKEKTLRLWAKQAQQFNQTQIFIETPYRNEKMFETLLRVLPPQTRLCIAKNITGEDEWIQTHRVADWKRINKPNLHKQPCLFLFL